MPLLKHGLLHSQVRVAHSCKPSSTCGLESICCVQMVSVCARMGLLGWLMGVLDVL